MRIGRCHSNSMSKHTFPSGIDPVWKNNDSIMELWSRVLALTDDGVVRDGGQVERRVAAAARLRQVDLWGEAPNGGLDRFCERRLGVGLPQRCPRALLHNIAERNTACQTIVSKRPQVTDGSRTRCAPVCAPLQRTKGWGRIPGRLRTSVNVPVQGHGLRMQVSPPPRHPPCNKTSMSLWSSITTKPTDLKSVAYNQIRLSCDMKTHANTKEQYKLYFLLTRPSVTQILQVQRCSAFRFSTLPVLV